MSKVTILGSGAAPGVPSLGKGWGNCDPNNPKNRRLRAGIYVEYNDTKILVDTSPDLRTHMLNNNITQADAVLLTHAHADHLHGIDDLREINRLTGQPIDFYTTKAQMNDARQRFGYLFSDDGKNMNPIKYPTLIPHTVAYNQKFYVKDVDITPIELIGHNLPSTGYVFNGGQIMLVADCESISRDVIDAYKGRVELLILPLTTPHKVVFHMDFNMLMEYVRIIAPKRVVITHMAVECDYETLDRMTPDFVQIGYDGLQIILEE